jgi:uncharacterized membrane protein YeaQ/YmgE (transglycosylase-associated protein family)
MRGGADGLIRDIIVGIVGSVIAGYPLPRIGVHLGAGLVGAVVNALSAHACFR